ncbi:MAG: DUF4258 domain-containing protein [Nitrospirae bacterium]|nr:DUF4258 domain-containing protein [Nitrospirota bacterium]
MDIEKLRRCIKEERYEWRKHTLIRLDERNILQERVLEVILNGEIIEDYPDNKPFPSCLILGFVSGKPYHAVIALDAEDPMAYIITAYEPSLNKFEPDFRTRRKK